MKYAITKNLPTTVIVGVGGIGKITPFREGYGKIRRTRENISRTIHCKIFRNMGRKVLTSVGTIDS